MTIQSIVPAWQYSHTPAVQHNVSTNSLCRPRGLYMRLVCDTAMNAYDLLFQSVPFNSTNETLPIFLDSILGGGVLAVASSTALILLFGEVIPQGELHFDCFSI